MRDAGSLFNRVEEFLEFISGLSGNREEASMKLYFDDDFIQEAIHGLQTIVPTLEVHGDDPSVIATVSEALTLNAAYLPALKSDLNDSKREDPQGTYVVRLRMLTELEDLARASLLAIRSHIVKLFTVTTPLDTVLLFSHYYLLTNDNIDTNNMLETPMITVTKAVTKHMSQTFKVDISATTFKCSGLLNLKVPTGRVFKYYLNKEPIRLLEETEDYFTSVVDSVVLLKDVKILPYNEHTSTGGLPVD